MVSGLVSDGVQVSKWSSLEAEIVVDEMAFIYLSASASSIYVAGHE